MKSTNQNINKNNKNQNLEKAAEAWVKLCIYNIKHRKLAANQNKKESKNYD